MRPSARSRPGTPASAADAGVPATGGDVPQGPFPSPPADDAAAWPVVSHLGRGIPVPLFLPQARILTRTDPAMSRGGCPEGFGLVGCEHGRAGGLCWP